MSADGLPVDPREAFDGFYRALHNGRRPFRWQARAAAELAEGRLPERLEAPTGSGKTTLIECFLFALAWQTGSAQRSVPLRLFWVIDRRGVVDQVYAHARALADRLKRHGTDGAIELVARRLRAYAGDAGQPAEEQAPVQVQRWRGGIEWDMTTLSPVVPAVVCSTVDQVGSRLLFRGYGTSRRSRPIDAALVGTDSLVVLDEAHLSGPMVDTSRAIAELQSAAPEPVARPLRVLTLSATLPDGGRPTFKPLESELQEPKLHKRLAAKKRVSVVRARTRVDGLTKEALRLAAPGRVVGVVANTVAEARAIHNALRSDHLNGLLVIGPSRPLDRDSVLERIPDRGERDPAASPLFVVATQTIEVGLDLDFDAVATSCAPFPALVQRFGRLARAGEPEVSEGAVVFSAEPCFVYGESVSETWEWLKAQAEDGVMELGPAAVRVLALKSPPEPPQPAVAPILAPWHVEALSQTSEDPVPSPDVAAFLHGERVLEAADVRVAWRADLDPGDPIDHWLERVELRPPHRLELLSLPLPAVRRWLRGIDAGAVADVESADVPAREEPGTPRPFIRVAADADGHVKAEPGELGSLRPGGVIVVPSAYRGCDEFGWAAWATTPRDLGDLAPGAPRLLLDGRTGVPEALAQAARECAEAIAAEAIGGGEAYEELAPRARAWVEERSAAEQGPYADALHVLADSLSRPGTAHAVPTARPTGVVLEPARVHPTRRITGPQSYGDHVARVETLARTFAKMSGLAPDLAHSVGLAARYHDTGKLDPRFQAWLNGGVPADPGKPLAKSGGSPSGRRADRDRIAAGWPKGKRHEAVSTALVAACGCLRDVDRDLLLHLIATHHGQHRPFLPREQPDDGPVPITADIEGERVTISSDAELTWNDLASRFARLNERFGPWGLAAIEAALVLADRRASEEAAQ